jgi:hypothetical protein
MRIWNTPFKIYFFTLTQCRSSIGNRQADSLQSVIPTLKFIWFSAICLNTSQALNLLGYGPVQLCDEESQTKVQRLNDAATAAMPTSYERSGHSKKNSDQLLLEKNVSACVLIAAQEGPPHSLCSRSDESILLALPRENDNHTGAVGEVKGRQCGAQ